MPRKTASKLENTELNEIEKPVVKKKTTARKSSTTKPTSKTSKASMEKEKKAKSSTKAVKSSSKKETSKVIKELTYNIGNVGVELKQSNESRQDIDIAAFTYNDAKYIRKELQINNEELYYLYIYINTYSQDKK